MAKSKYFDPGIEIFFVSNNEKTLPLRETIIEKIENCIPSKYKIVYNNEATYNRAFLEEATIYYHVEKVDPNRYKIYLKYSSSTGILGYVYMFTGLALGGYIGYVLFMVIGAFIGGGVGTLLFTPNAVPKDAEKVCDKIATEIKEYERAHLLSVSTR